MKYWIDFSSSIQVEADNAEQAKEMFWNICSEKFPELTYTELNCVEEIKED